MGSHEKKMHLVDMNSLSILFHAKSEVSHSPPLRNITSSLDRNFSIPWFERNCFMARLIYSPLMLERNICGVA